MRGGFECQQHSTRIFDILDLKTPSHKSGYSEGGLTSSLLKLKKVDVPEKKLKTSLPVAVFPNSQYYPVHSAAIPLPPKWSKRKSETTLMTTPFKLFPVDPKTSEYATIAALLYPYPISDVEQIVNPVLWSRFESYRKEMLKTKSNDIKYLSDLGLTEDEFLAEFKRFDSFERSPEVKNIPYSDNIALLFHCTRSPASIKDILSQGLDERVGKQDSLLGKGIYFTDNPRKSITYDQTGGNIFIFAVLLGDCSSIDHFEEKKLVREPPKIREQQRSANDLFFDSIIARPGLGGDNEYVVYNRLQCYPLYKISYAPAPAKKAKIVAEDIKLYMETRKNLPPFSWTLAKEKKNVLHHWPFYAKTIFEKMRGRKENDSSESLIAPIYPLKVRQTASNYCTICGNESVNRAKYWNVLQCGHKICVQCYQKIAATRTTMSGETHTFAKCPICKRTSGIEVGDCPLGTMTVYYIPIHCDGYEPFPSIAINYVIEDGRSSLNETAFLPFNNEGTKILKLLTIAWDRRICITLLKDITTGSEHIVWNIPHKTSQSGGTSLGYPDKSYLKTVESELKLYGIE